MLSEEKRLAEFVDHYRPFLVEIRRRIGQVGAAFAGGFVIGVAFHRKIIVSLIAVFNFENVNVVVTSPYQFVNLAINIGLFLGIVFAFPLLIFHLITFVRPAVTQREFKTIKQLFPLSILLFMIGSAFGVWMEQVIVSLYARTSLEYSVSNIWDIQAFLSQMIFMAAIMGIVFQLPIILTTLIKANLVSIELLVAKRRIFYLFLIVFAILLPSTDILSLVLIISPLLLLFEGTIFLNR